MQRVAIARALINDPEILLADEPTGGSRIQRPACNMAMLTSIAKDRLVVMVTHNPELAQEYATRTVWPRDGRISKWILTRLFPVQQTRKIIPEGHRRTSMSLATAVALSFKNLMTKKGRTLMTALQVLSESLVSQRFWL